MLARAALFAALVAGAGQADTITGARYAEPTNRYPHAVLGDDVEFGTLVLEIAGGPDLRLTLPETSVFEDVAPRLADLDGDGAPEVVTVESDQTRGARLAVYGTDGLIAATPHIGTRFRWLAPIGIADLDRDGAVEIAYVDRPHLAKTLRIVRFDGDRLTPVGDSEGFTNHRIGEPDIGGGIRDCGDGPEMIVASRNWQTVMSVRFIAGAIISRPLGPYVDRSSFAAALDCAL
ncbi:MAG: VCBS repeat-containing protein [Pseudomonadota bacterium]